MYVFSFDERLSMSFPEERLRGGQSHVVVVDEDLAEDGGRAEQQRDELPQQDRLPNIAAIRVRYITKYCSLFFLEIFGAWVWLITPCYVVTLVISTRSQEPIEFKRGLNALKHGKHAVRSLVCNARMRGEEAVTA